LVGQHTATLENGVQVDTEDPMALWSMLRDELQTLVGWALGSIPHKVPEKGSAALIGWICIVSCFAFIAGEWHSLSGHPLLRSFFRLTVHGAVPLAGVVLWGAVQRRRGVGLALAAAVLTTGPVLYRMMASSGLQTLREHPALLVVPTVVGGLLALAAARRSGEGVGVWGLGVGDWRWWVPRAGLALFVLVAGCVLTTLAVDSLADFYPTGGWARKNWTNFGLRHMGILVDFLGWEFLFRGVLLFGFYRRGDPWTAIWVQAIPFFLLHYDKPSVELALSLVGGAVSGWFTLRARSIYPLILLHWAQITTVGFVGQLLRTLA
jgi:membrane protease YdiL (CAAX protease family)